MSLFQQHQHQWGEATMTFSPATSPNLMSRPMYATSEQFDRMVHGFTTIVQRCTTCGKVGTSTVLGKAEQ